MSETPQQATAPAGIRYLPDGKIDNGSLADIVEWFLNFDERTARMRHPHTDELFQWKQKDDEENGIGTYPFPNAEARFAVGTIQAIHENSSEPLLKLWITDVLSALHDARETRNELTAAYGLDADLESSAVERAEKIPTRTERRLYLTCSWIEALCTAEARVLGWLYQEIYGKIFAP
jgi:hypothetical protein